MATVDALEWERRKAEVKAKAATAEQQRASRTGVIKIRAILVNEANEVVADTSLPKEPGPPMFVSIATRGFLFDKATSDRKGSWFFREVSHVRIR